jgi:hypothetical protein
MHDANALFLRSSEPSAEGLGGLPLFTELPRRGLLGNQASGSPMAEKVTFSEVRPAPVQHPWASRTQLGCLRVLASLLGA